jgi:glycosyltransferase involved in cell wall biosynthesis
MKTTVVVPCFNEEQRLQLERFLELCAAGIRLLFVDDGSKDGTRRLLQDFAARHPREVRVLGLDRNGGKAEAVRRGLLEALSSGAEIVGYLDADLAAPPAEMKRVLDAVRGGAAVAMGSRVALLGRHIERAATRHYLGRVFATCASFTLGLRVYDTQCGAKAFAVNPTLQACLTQPFQSRWIFDVELIDRLLRPPPGVPSLAPSDFIEVPLHAWRDVRGSKVRPPDLARAATDLLEIAWRRRR